MTFTCFLCVDGQHKVGASLEQHLTSHLKVEKEADVLLAVQRLGRQRRRELVMMESHIASTRAERKFDKIADSQKAEDDAAVLKKKQVLKSEKELTAEVMNNPDILEDIFRHLPPKDIKTVALVSKMWRQVVEKPRYWTWARINLNIFFNSVIEMYLDSASSGEKSSSRRFENISRVRLDEREGTLVSPSNLSKATVNKMEVNLHGNAELGKEQLEAVFKGFAEINELKLRKLTLDGVELWEVSPDILSEAICRVDTVYFDQLNEFEVGYNQAAALFNKIQQYSSKDLKLRELIFWDDDDFYRSRIPPEVFARAIIRLEEVGLHGANDDCISELFTVLAHSREFKLRSIDFYSKDLTEISPKIFSRAIIKLEEVDLGDSYVTNEQVKAVIKSIVKAEKVRLRSWYVEPNFDFDIAPHAKDLLQAKKRVEKLKIRVDRQLL